MELCGVSASPSGAAGAPECERPVGHDGPHVASYEWPDRRGPVAPSAPVKVDPRPTQGRIVRYVETNYAADVQPALTTWPALVVLVHADRDPLDVRLGLNVFKPYGMNEWHEAVAFSATPAADSWHWPAREG